MDPDEAGRVLLGFRAEGNADEIPEIPANATGDERIATINKLIRAHNRRLTQQIWTDGTHRRMLIGYQEDGWGTGKHWGVKISEPGFDVMVAADADLLFKLTY